MGNRIPRAEWETIVRNVPIVSVDLVVRHGNGVVLGRRRNEPAAGEWFVPGGRVHKGERLTAAVHRIAGEELGVSVGIDRRLGVYEHHYDVAELDDVGGKHYVPVGYLVDTEDEGDGFDPDDQHDGLRVFSPPFDGIDLHPYVRAYLADAGVLTDPADG